MTRKHVVVEKEDEVQFQTDVWSSQWLCTLSVLMFVIAFGLSGQILPRFAPSQCTSEQGMCTPGACTCPFPLMKRDLVTQDALACSQCVEEFCPAVAGGASTCSESACECEDPSWPRIDVGTPERQCWQCVRPHVDMTLRSAGVDDTCLHVIDDADGMQLASSNSSSCTVFRFTGSSILAKAHNNSCLAWADTWKLVPCGSKPIKFAQRTLTKDEGVRRDMYCVGKQKQSCLQAVEYMCTTDSAQCSMGSCRCEDSSHIRKEMQTVNRSVCHVCGPPLPSCPTFSDSCAPGPCECHNGLVKVRRSEDCFSCRAGPDPPTGLETFLSLASAIATFLCCVALGIAFACAIRRVFVGEVAEMPISNRQRRRPTPRTWSERWALYLEDTFQAVCECARSCKSLQSVSVALCNFIDMCDDTLDPAYVFLERGMDALQSSLLAFYQENCRRRAVAESKRRIKKEKDSHRQKTASRQSAPPCSDSGKDASLPGISQSEAMSMVHQGNVASCGAPAKEERVSCAVPGLAHREAIAHMARPARSSPVASSTVQRLRQRRDAKAIAAKAAQQASQAPAEEVQDAPVDESWIDAMEQEDEKEKEASRERAAAQKRERKTTRARRARYGAEGAQENGNDQTDRHSEIAAASDKVEEEKLQQDDEDGGGNQDEIAANEATHGFFALAAPEAGTGDEENCVKIIEAKTVYVQDGAKSCEAEEDSDEGWIKSSSLKMRIARRRGEMPAEQEPAAEPDPQPEAESRQEPHPDRQSEQSEQSTPLDMQPQPDPPSLSKRQRQRLRQRQAIEDARASGRKPEHRPEAAAKLAATLPATPQVEQATAAPKCAADGGAEEDQPKTAEPGKAFSPAAVEPSFADIVAGRPARLPGNEPESQEARKQQFAADAPDFVPLAARNDVVPFQGIVTVFPIQSSENNLGYLPQAGVAEEMISGQYAFPAFWSFDPKCMLSNKYPPQIYEQVHKTKLCVEVSCLPCDTTSSGFMNQLDIWGLTGTYNFLHVVNGEDACTAFVNFIDPVFVMLFCCMCQEYNFQGSIATAEVQGLEALKVHWSDQDIHKDTEQPMILADAKPTQWAVNAVNNMLSPHPLKDQFRKTKMCAYNKKRMCEMGQGCPYAHSKGELQPMPDLVKTKMCYNYFQRRCTDAQCKFAHGSVELRSVWTQMPYGTWPMEEAFQWNPLGQEIHGATWKSDGQSRRQGDAVLFEALSQEGKARESGHSEGKVGDIALRVRNSFLEVMQVETEEDEAAGGNHSIKRSFSDSHIESLKEAMHDAKEP